MKRTYIFIIFQIISLSVFAQYFGGHPKNIDWRSIDNENVRLIYPRGLNIQAQRIADIVNHINKNNVYSVGNKSKKLDIVLHTNQVISNGFVGLAPYRSEFFGIGMQNMNRLGSVDWLDVLSIHEYRHALQFANSKYGFSKFMSYLFGQIGWAGAINFSIPNWYFEGDAVVTETLLSEGGRGRMPSFYKEIRANLLSGKKYSYMVARNGSYNRMLPSIYPMGFAICNYTRNNYGTNIWKNILKDAGRYSKIIYPFSRAMKKHADFSSRKMYKKAFQQLKTDWETELQNIELTPVTEVSPPVKRTVTNYQFPQVMNDGTIVAIKNSYKETSSIVGIKDREENKITTYGISQDVYLSSNNNILVWTEFETDMRRGNVNYNKIISYDYNTKLKKVVCRKTKYYSPHISSDGNKIVAVNINEQMQNNLVIIDAHTGKQIAKLPNINNDFLSFPKWTNDNKHIVYIAKRKSKLALIKMNIDSQKRTLLTNWSSHVIGATSMGESHVYFSASYSGIDNIYAVDLNGNKQIKQLTSVKVGVYQPCINNKGNSLTMSRFTSMGYGLATLKLSKNISDYSNISYKEPKEQLRYNIQTTKYENNILNSIEKGNYEEKSYNGFFRGMKFHSWFFTLEQDIIGFNIFMNNTLNNLTGLFGIEYNNNDETYGYNATIAYAKWFPVISLSSRLGQRKDSPLILSNTTNKAKEADIQFGVSIPLTWVENQYVIQLNTSAAIKYSKIFDTGDLYITHSDFASMSSVLEFSVLHSKARQNIMPKLGLQLEAGLNYATNNVKAKKVYTNTTVFLPSVFKNHGFKINSAFNWEKQSNEYIYEDRFKYSRGYSAIANDQIYRLSANYSFPMLYPNWGFAGLIHFKRIRANMFMDISQAKWQDSKYDMNSYGAELIFDNKFYNLIPLSIGVRESFLLDTDWKYPNRKQWTEIFVSINL